MPASGLALAASGALRVASLNLCTDEYLLLLARPQQIVSLSHLSHNAQETSLSAQARQFSANSGSLESVLRFRPTLVLTMGGAGRSTAAIARRIGVRVLDLPFPATVAQVEAQAMRVAAVLGQPRRAALLQDRLAALRRTSPPPRDAAYVSGGGLSLAPDGLGAEWMRLAGYRQRALAGNRLNLELLATRPPAWLIRSDYRSRQWDRGQAWLRHPVVRRLASRTIDSDGRPWTCGGLPMIEEVERLRRLRR